MADVARLPFPRIGDMFIDARGDDRTMRVSLHPERGIVVVSLWAGTTCRASFQLPAEDASRLASLIDGPSAVAAVSDPGTVEPDHPYPGLEGTDIHTTGMIFPQAS